MQKLKPLSLKRQLLARNNARQTQQMELIAGIDAFLAEQKALLQVAGRPVTWDEFTQTQAYADASQGIDGPTLQRIQKLWEGT